MPGKSHPSRSAAQATLFKQSYLSHPMPLQNGTIWTVLRLHKVASFKPSYASIKWHHCFTFWTLATFSLCMHFCVLPYSNTITHLLIFSRKKYAHDHKMWHQWEEHSNLLQNDRVTLCIQAQNVAKLAKAPHKNAQEHKMCQAERYLMRDVPHR